MPIVEAACAAIIVLALVVLVMRGLAQRGVPKAARRMVAIGLSLLLLGAAQYGMQYLSPSLNAMLSGNSFVSLWLHQILLMCGAMCLTIGLLLLGKQATQEGKEQRLRGKLMRTTTSLQSTQEGQEQRLRGMLMETTTTLQSTKGILDSILISSPGGLLVLKAMRNKAREVEDFEFRLCNPAFELLLGKSRKDIVGASLLKTIPCLKAEGLFDKAVCLVDTDLPLHMEHKCRTGEDEKWYEIVAVKHCDGIAATVSDITDRKRIEEQLRKIAHTDALTGLANRALLKERLDQAITRSRRTKGYSFAVMFLDFDRFKIVNDSLGHDVGDQLLISISERLRANIRALDLAPASNDGHLPARLGGDEFVILLDGVKDLGHAAIIAERLQKDLATPHRLGGNEVTSTASIGIVTCTGQYETADEVLRDADTAMYHAKMAGKARHAVFDVAMHQSAIDRMNLEADLRKAVEREMFLLEYQPIAELESGGIVGFEALIRWPHPDRGVLPPAEFLGLAEELDLMIDIGRWVLRHACERLIHMQSLRPDGPPITMNINHSRQEILHKDFVAHVADVIQETGVDPASLRLEVTENICMSHPTEVVPVLHQLKDLGVMLAMDDFGTGHSSFSRLDQMPFDTLKIDRCFLQSNREKRGYAAILQSMIDLAHNLQMSTVVEGVETSDHLTLLQAMGSEYGQGWLFGKSVPAEEAEKMLHRSTNISTAA